MYVIEIIVGMLNRVYVVFCDLYFTFGDSFTQEAAKEQPSKTEEAFG